ncbi:MAG: extensin family protein, partial [Pseudomonadota bacterium]|nr:extensin family protein [Pseudomonadota bacterium]
MARFLAWLFTAASLAIVVGSVFVALGVVTVPPSYNPWRPLETREEPNFLTRYKLARLERHRQECAAVLNRSGVAHTPVPDQTTGEGCGFTGAVRLTRSGVTFGSDFVATCPLAVAWALFEAHALQPAARRHFGQDVARV